MELDYKALSIKLCELDTSAALVNYIFQIQGGDRRRLNYVEAAKSLNVSERTISRYVAELADKKLLILYGMAGKGSGEVQLSSDILVD